MPAYFLSSDEETKVQQVRAEYQPLFEAFNRPAPMPFADEGPEKFRRRALSTLQSSVPGFEDLKIDNYLREPNFKYIEQQILTAAKQEARHPTNIPEGQLREVRKTDESGRPIIEFYGSPSSWMQNFMPPTVKRVVNIRRETERGYNPGNLGSLPRKW